ncbi:MAG: YciI family protein [Alphaproteobacteria bacterium]
MLFAFICIDKPDSARTRAQNRPDHLAYLEGLEDKITIAGPLLTDDRSAPTGSLLILDFDSQAEAKAFAAGDPYNKAGVFEKVFINPFKQIFPAPAE